MANVASTRFVFDRKKTATREKKGLVQIEVLYRGRRKWMTTGIKVYSDQWTEKCHVVKCVEAVDYNRRLDSMKAKVDGYITDLVEQRREFDFDALPDGITPRRRRSRRSSSGWRISWRHAAT